MELTEKQYWEAFWDRVVLPSKVNLDFSNDANIATILNKFLTINSEKRAFEVGCAPGKWLIYLAENFNYSVDGCEYIEAASKKTRENLNICGITEYNIYTGDFLEIEFENKYDVVISLGFIEHFVDSDSVCKKHASLLKENGILVIGVPKLTGLNYYLAKQVDKSIDDKLIPNHNLDIMNLEHFKKMGNVIGCDNMFVDVIGGFEPALFDISKSPIWFKIVFHIINLIINNSFFRRINHPYYSSYIIGVYQKND
jgi:cyclopropane fatty-acyl-phospholipid synthase-like methyltransferase